MIIIGLTGSIGMGKTTVARLCEQLGIPALNADDVVHRLMAPGGKAFTAVAKAFPDAIADGKIDRARLGQIVFADPAKLDMLEAILHPLVADERNAFLERHKDSPVVVLDIPLLFEKRLEGTVDVIVTVSAPAEVQTARVMARPGMSAEKYASILARQMPDEEKRRRSDHVINTGGGEGEALKQLQAILKAIDSSHAPNRP